MQHGAHIGPSVVVKGEISAKEPLTVAGRVEGIIDVPGHVVTIEAGAHVIADVSAAGIIVAGSVTGSLEAEDRIALHAGAEVRGDLTAPRLVVEDGARVTGKAIIAGSRALKLAQAS
jgi:cytoskeletal protein CcmA (bactofilin family)